MRKKKTAGRLPRKTGKSTLQELVDEANKRLVQIEKDLQIHLVGQLVFKPDGITPVPAWVDMRKEENV